MDFPIMHVQVALDKEICLVIGSVHLNKGTLPCVTSTRSHHQGRRSDDLTYLWADSARFPLWGFNFLSSCLRQQCSPFTSFLLFQKLENVAPPPCLLDSSTIYFFASFSSAQPSQGLGESLTGQIETAWHPRSSLWSTEVAKSMASGQDPKVSQINWKNLIFPQSLVLEMNFLIIIVQALWSSSPVFLTPFQNRYLFLRQIMAKESDLTLLSNYLETVSIWYF